MNWVREQLGFRAYESQAPRILVHWLLLATLVAATAKAVLSRYRDSLPELATSWGLLGLGAIVTVLHGSSFGYFLMTVGLFPAIALGLMASRITATSPRIRNGVVAALAVLLFLGAMPETLQMLHGSQADQRATMEFVRTSELANYRGYQVEGALACAADPDPMPVMFSQQISRRLKNSPEAIGEFIAEFRLRPIAYIVESYRMNQFPEAIREFWRDHYLRHSGSLFVAGATIGTEPGLRQVEILAGGEYRWTPRALDRTRALKVGGTTIEAHSTATLAPGRYLAETVPAGGAGVLVLAVPHWPGSDFAPFYDERQMRRLGGLQ
jgi:hypothetical protein